LLSRKQERHHAASVGPSLQRGKKKKSARPTKIEPPATDSNEVRGEPAGAKGLEQRASFLFELFSENPRQRHFFGVGAQRG
jgi:hypothetical protein